MLTDLSFLELGQVWPPESETERLQTYRHNQLLFESKAEDVYGRWVTLLSETTGNTLEETHYVLSFHRRLSFLWSDLVAGETPTLGAEQDEASERVLDISNAAHFGITLQEAVVDTSRYGDALFRVSRTDEGKARIRPVSPAYWYPVVDPADIRNIKTHVLARLFENGNDNFLRVELHDTEIIEHRLYKLENARLKERVSNPRGMFPEWQDFEELPPGVEGPLLVHAPGVRTSERLHGLDDYTAIDSKMEYLMWLMAQRQGILHKHLAPNMAGPPGQLATLADGSSAYVSGSRYFEIEDATSVIPQYVTWDGKLEASFTQTAELWSDVYLTSETSPSAFGHSETGFAESGTSLKLRMVAPLKKAARIQERFDDPVKRVFTLACALEGLSGVEPRIEWKDGLPEDTKEMSEVEAQRVAAGLTSIKSALKRMYGYTDEQADEELQRIQEEERARAPTAPGFSTSALNLDLANPQLEQSTNGTTNNAT